ncbi:hypothetical protein GV054_09135 [Marinomonas mediterranea]|jgi:hypothetical protein|uniref:Uncharacterized protein n=1 Tax=Marinomonas mediterranea (strain ATCC 700492 / JCM 21426 / NBRC 103028 / MMB-1) TaxID=717774 RepID=F2K219_MARM1|nr:hypothetical protein [Marinomonas mediterranea]ADZ91097.1 hypothetical protein Marme_1841 [Marinomonas mediterranea MMB-1]WCN13158.1 hypothetical protein GV054_09135 [Marinomonas mediterranea]WCN17229.1 hypothetical protein GV053_09295 [Marinomonas mediterranea MMB-1]
MSFDKALNRANKRVFRKVGTPVFVYSAEESFETSGIFDNPELLEKLNGLKGRHSNVEFKTTEKLLSIPSPLQEIEDWHCRIANETFFIENTLHDGSGETLCILSTQTPEKLTHTENSDYGL